MVFLSKLLKAVAFLPSIITGIEPLFGSGSGDTKRSAAVGLVGSILGMAESISAKDIVDEKNFQEGLKEAIDGIVKMLNASVWAKRSV